MNVELNENRINFSDNTRQILYDEVKGFCPICGKKLTHEKNRRLYKSFDVAHIYPLNPNNEQKELLKNEERLSDVNDLGNLLATCKDCHYKYDNPRTIEEYKQWIAIKKRLINDNKAKSIYCEYNLEKRNL